MHLSAKGLTIIFFLLALRLIGQSPFLKSQSNISLGYGFFNLDILNTMQDLEDYDAYYILQGSTFTYDHQITGPLFFKYEYAPGNAFGIGLNICYYNYLLSETFIIRNNTYTSPEYRNEYIGKNFSIGMRFNYHINGGHKKYDPYIGIAAGYSNYLFQEKGYTNGKISYKGKEQTLFPFYFGITFGARLDLTPWLGIYGEVGIDAWTIIQTGINFRLNSKSRKLSTT
ncbi:MAG: hypothetical protein MUF75_03895 [Bacteroidia bacterium]|jgi:hypothetical protein|nr:hypothetical protein [Bacteroidia bacterium]